MSGICYYWLERMIIAVDRHNGYLGEAIGHEWKGLTSTCFYVAGMVLAFVSPLLALALYFASAMMWFAPDKRIERAAGRSHEAEK
jgi:hypothetical protein